MRIRRRTRRSSARSGPGARTALRFRMILCTKWIAACMKTVSSRQYFLRMITALGKRGCDAVVLGCTEIPLLIAESESPLPVIDSMRTLARAALGAAMQPRRS
jgi:aspartate racemase